MSNQIPQLKSVPSRIVRICMLTWTIFYFHTIHLHNTVILFISLGNLSWQFSQIQKSHATREFCKIRYSYFMMLVLANTIKHRKLMATKIYRWTVHDHIHIYNVVQIQDQNRSKLYIKLNSLILFVNLDNSKSISLQKLRYFQLVSREVCEI